MRSAPEKSLSYAAVKAWRISMAIYIILAQMGCLILLAVILGINYSMSVFMWIFATMILVTALCIYFIPEVRRRRWHYQVDEHEVDLQSGIFVITRTLVPIQRVQHVKTRQGPILRFYDLADVTISTAATTHRIPALDEKTADSVRNKISKLAGLASQDV